jgi:tRNA threonylcarbamoyladenosine modification (KEOPS) complex  Pcc1 subunit
VAESIYSAMLPDLRNLQGKDKLEMSLQDSAIHFSVQATDLASLRANINSYLRLADAAYRCISNSTL